MPQSVMDYDLLEIERRHSLETRHIDAELVGVRAALVVGVDPANTAEMMFGDAGVEAVGRELVFALRDLEGIWRRRNRDGAAHAADRAGAAPRRGEAFGQRRRELHRAAVA